MRVCNGRSLVELLAVHRPYSTTVEDSTERHGYNVATSERKDPLNLPDSRLHDLRHLAGTLTAQAGGTVRETMDRLGHTSAAASMRYQHVADTRGQKLAENLDRLLGY
jgi:integrase